MTLPNDWWRGETHERKMREERSREYDRARRKKEAASAREDKIFDVAQWAIVAGLVVLVVTMFTLVASRS